MRVIPKSNWARGILLVGLILFAWAIFIEIFWIPASRKKVRQEAVVSQTGPVNEVLTRRVEVTGDGALDEIRLNLEGAAWDQPFKWTLAITSNNKLVYEQSADDAWLDRFFNDKGYVDEKCSGYLACKKQYYLEDFLKHLFHRVELGKEQFNDASLSEMRKIAKEELIIKFSLTPSEAERTAGWMAEHFKSGNAMLLNVPKSPVQSEFSQMYVPRVGRFVTVANED